jgi:hypothetical protein
MGKASTKQHMAQALQLAAWGAFASALTKGMSCVGVCT